MSFTSSMNTLAHYRSVNTRKSQETFELGVKLLESNKLAGLGDDAWAFLEQLFLASIDVGRLDVADTCLKRLLKQFPESPRANILSGIRMEATEPPEVALTFYQTLLEEDATNAAAWKRKVSVTRRLGKTENTVIDLVEYLDTFYTDVEGWLELSDIYSSCNQYSQALQALSHVLLLAPQNAFYVLQFAETAYTASDLPLALKTFLLVVEMCDRDRDVPLDAEASAGLSTRAWWGVKATVQTLLALSDPSSAPSASKTSVAGISKLNHLEALATERVLSAYSAAGKFHPDAASRDIVLKWMTAR